MCCRAFIDIHFQNEPSYLQKNFHLSWRSVFWAASLWCWQILKAWHAPLLGALALLCRGLKPALLMASLWSSPLETVAEQGLSGSQSKPQPLSLPLTGDISEALKQFSVQDKGEALPDEVKVEAWSEQAAL